MAKQTARYQRGAGAALMKHWIQFYHLRNGAWVEAIASDSVACPDGRWSRAHMEAWAKELGVKRGMDGYRLARGQHLSRPFYLNAAVKPCNQEQSR